jgi:ribosomal protein S14
VSNSTPTASGPVSVGAARAKVGLCRPSLRKVAGITADLAIIAGNRFVALIHNGVEIAGFRRNKVIFRHRLGRRPQHGCAKFQAQLRLNFHALARVYREKGTAGRFEIARRSRCFRQAARRGIPKLSPAYSERSRRNATKENSRRDDLFYFRSRSSNSFILFYDSRQLTSPLIVH